MYFLTSSDYYEEIWFSFKLLCSKSVSYSVIFFPLLFVLFKCSGACIAFWIDVLVNMLHGYGDKSPFRHSSSIGFLEGKEEKIFLRCQ